MTLKITLIGLGKMGGAMANHLLKRGYDLTVYNRTTEKMKAYIEAGAKGAVSPKEAVKEADIIVTCLFDDAVTLDMLKADNGILAGMKPGAIHMCTATILPTTATALSQLHQAQGSIYVACPVIGAAPTAVAGKLLSVLAGEASAIEACKPICSCFSSQVMCVGDDPSKANIMKICFHYTLAASIETMSEVYAFADKSGFDLDTINAIFYKVYEHPAFHMYADKIKNRDFKVPGLDLVAGIKDVTVFQQAFKDVGANADIADIIKDKMLPVLDAGLGDNDWSVNYETTRQRMGLDSLIDE